MKLAEESEKTKKAREKLKKKFAVIDEKINTQALDRKSKEIHRWISRQQSRVPLKNKSFKLFDENMHPADESRKVLNLALRLGEDLSKPLEMLLKENSVL
ncbi:MAG TPA: hypothetical protein PLO43_02990 [Chlamydiales bacterium]|nr:hypothetical protein [Chlamydiales bacterium]HPE85125.1 hypothetical protein [Chlamydiales bacterium]